MKPLKIAALAAYVLAALFKGWGAGLAIVLFLLVVTLYFRGFGARNSIILAPLIVSGPLFAYFLTYPFLFRSSVILIYGLLTFWFLNDAAKLSKGSLISLEKLALFLSAGSFSITAIAYILMASFTDARMLILVSVLTTLPGVFILRSLTETTQGIKTPSAQIWGDVLIISLVIGEFFVAFSFLPFSPLTLSGGLTVIAFSLTTIISSVRAQTMTKKRAFKLSALTSVFLIILFGLSPWKLFG